MVGGSTLSEERFMMVEGLGMEGGNCKEEYKLEGVSLEGK
jgi:hypothetical protein